MTLTTLIVLSTSFLYVLKHKRILVSIWFTFG